MTALLPSSSASAPALVQGAFHVSSTSAPGSTGDPVDHVNLFVLVPGAATYVPATADYVPAGDGVYGFYSVAVDTHGRTEPAPDVPDVSVRVDSTAPTSHANAPAFANGTIHVTATADDGGSGVDHVDLLVQAPGSSDYVPAAFDYTPTAEGTYRFRTVATDKAGNVEAPGAPAETVYDATPPVVTAHAPALTNTPSITVTSDVNEAAGVDLYARAPGEAAYSLVTGPYTATKGDGTYRFYVVAHDRAGNTAQSDPVATLLDTIAPSSQASSPATARGPFTVAHTESDGGSGVDHVDLFVQAPGAGTYVPASFDFTPTAEGTYRFYTVATDQAGNREAPGTPSSTVYDTTAPVSSASSPASASGASFVVGYSASDGGSGVGTVDVYARGPGDSAFAKVYSDSASGTFAFHPGGGSGTYRFYTVATDRAGNAESTSAAQTSTDYSSDAAPPSSRAGAPATSATTTFTVPYTADDGANGVGVAKVDLYADPPGTASYTLVASDTSGTGAFTYTAGANGTYAFYTVATDRNGNVEAAPGTADSSTVVTKDTTKPASKATALAASNASPFTVSYTATDTGGAGVASVELWARPPGQTAYALAASDLGNTGTFDFVPAAEGSYAFYTVAVDRQGNRETAPTSADGTTIYDITAPPTFSMTAPGAYLRGVVAMKVSPNPTDSGSGVGAVQYQYRLTGASAWLEGCTTTKANWGCNWDTTALADGSYDIRAVVTDKAGNGPTPASNGVYTRPLDNTAPTGTDVATKNATGKPAGIPNQGDTLSLTYSEPMKASTMLSGWTGTSSRVQVRLIDDPAGDRLEIWNQAGTARVALANPVALGGDYVPASGAVFGSSTATGTAASTMVMSANTVTVTLGAVSSGAVNASAVAGTLAWTPDVVATDLAGNPASAAAVLETGPLF